MQLVFVLNMITTLLAGAFASSILATSIPATKSAAVIPYVTVLSQDTFSSHTVENGEYLSKIANDYYGSEDYWTNIWNDNPELQDATQLEPGMVLKIRTQKTLLPEVLKSELSAKTEIKEVVVVQPLYTYNAEVGASVSPVPTAQPQAVPASTDTPKVLTEVQINYLGNCEAGMNPARNSGNGYYGAFQFSEGTWNSMNTGYARADLAPLEVQKAAVQRLVARSNIFSQFPGCSKRMRSEGLI